MVSITERHKRLKEKADAQLKRYNDRLNKGIKLPYMKERKEFTNKRAEEQQNKCLICGQDFHQFNIKHLDHCHKSKRYRGILCGHCNKGLGMFKDNVEYLQNAIDYLKKHDYNNKFWNEDKAWIVNDNGSISRINKPKWG